MNVTYLHNLHKNALSITIMATKEAKNIKMVNEIALHEGEILRVLIKRAGYRVDEFAKLLDLNPHSLSRIFKSEKLTNKVKSRSAWILGVDISIFGTGIGGEVLDLGEPNEEYKALQEEVDRLHDEVRRLSAEVAREKGINEDLRKLLLKISGAG